MLSSLGSFALSGSCIVDANRNTEKLTRLVCQPQNKECLKVTATYFLPAGVDSLITYHQFTIDESRHIKKDSHNVLISVSFDTGMAHSDVVVAT